MASRVKYDPSGKPREDDGVKVDFSKLGIRTLKRYKRRYRLKQQVRHNPSKQELVQAIQNHFAYHRVEEADVIDFFLYAAKNYKDKPLRDD